MGAAGNPTDSTDEVFIRPAHAGGNVEDVVVTRMRLIKLMLKCQT